MTNREVEQNISDVDEHKQALAKLSRLTGFIEMEMKGSKKSGVSLKKKARRHEIWVICLSAIVTILLGVDLSEHKLITPWIKNAAVIFSATVTAFHTWNAFANYNARSVQEQMMVNKLSLLYKDIILYTEGNDKCKISDYELFKDRYDKVMEEYLQERTPNDKEKEKSE